MMGLLPRPVLQERAGGEGSGDSLIDHGTGRNCGRG
jgi:hypothetical protein